MNLKNPSELPQNPDYTEFLFFEAIILPHELSRINQFWQDEASHPATLTEEFSDNDEIRKSKLIEIAFDDTKEWLFSKLSSFALHCNNNYYHFDLQGFHEPLQLIQYNEGDFFDWHLDFGAGSVSQRKLSIVIQLSSPDDYEGGNFQFMINNRQVDAPQAAGTVIVFPSFVAHRVTPIIRGVRHSIIGWLAGPPFR